MVSTRVDSFAEWRAAFTVLLAEDWFIWVEHRPSGLVYGYNTELWPEWLDVPRGDYMGESSPADGPAVARMIPFAWRHSPRPWPVWDDERQCETDEQETRAGWDARTARENEGMLDRVLARAYAD